VKERVNRIGKTGKTWLHSCLFVKTRITVKHKKKNLYNIIHYIFEHIRRLTHLTTP